MTFLLPMVPMFSENDKSVITQPWSFFHCLKLDVWEEFQDCTGGRGGCFGWVYICAPCLIWWDHLSMKARKRRFSNLGTEPTGECSEGCSSSTQRATLGTRLYPWQPVFPGAESKNQRQQKRLKSKCSKPEKAAHPPSWHPMRQRPRSKDVVPSAD